MIPPDLHALETHPYTTRVEAAGGRETSWWWSSQISSDEFYTALQDSLTRSGVFQRVISTGDADYSLDVFITNVRQPIMGFNMTVGVTAKWTLTDLSTGEDVFAEVVDSQYTATVGDAFAGVKRLRLANEGAARANIEQGIHKLAAWNP